MDRQLRAFIAEVERESGLQVALKQVSHYPAAPFDAECQQAIADDSAAAGLSRRGRSSPAPGMTQCMRELPGAHRDDFYPLQGRDQP